MSKTDLTVEHHLQSTSIATRVVMHMAAPGENLTGTADSDTLAGGEGDDTLDGVTGSDSISGGDGNDVFISEGGTHYDESTLSGGNGDDVFLIKREHTPPTALTIDGGDGADLFDIDVSTSVFFSYLTGGAGRDTYKFHYNADSEFYANFKDFSAGANGDLLDITALMQYSTQYGGYTGGDFVAKGYLGFVQYEGYTEVVYDFNGAGNTAVGRKVLVLDNVVATAITSANLLVGGMRVEGTAGADKLFGASGDDTLVGGTGKDTMQGGAGDDLYQVDDAGDVVTELANNGTDRVQTTLATYTLGANIENLAYTGKTAFTGTGNALDNVIAGGDAGNKLNGGAGNDTLVGGNGSDELDGGLGADLMAGGKGNDSYIVNDAGDVVTELADEGLDGVSTTLSSYTLGANVEALTYKGTGAFTGVGNELNNYLTGGNGGAKLDGGAGSDSIAGGTGNDSLLGGAGDDLFSINGGKDTIDGGADYDTVIGLKSLASYTVTRLNATDALLTDTSGNTITLRNVEQLSFAGDYRTIEQVLLKANFGDQVAGTSGNDTLDGGLGVDTMSGGAGDDAYTVDNVLDVVVEKADEGADLVQVALTAAGTYVMTANVENATVTAAATIAANISGNALDNRLTGNAAANTLIGGAGDDTLDGGAGADKLSGGTGDDTYVVDVAGDVVTELANEGNDTVKTALATYTVGANVENVTYTGAAAFTATGNALDNKLAGGNAGNKFDGGAGNDTLIGGSGNDSLQGGLGDDSITAGNGKDTVDGGAGQDVLRINGNFADYTVSRPNATDVLLTSTGGNTLTVRGVESFIFADGDKVLADLLGNKASAFNDILTGTGGNDTLNGLQGADTLTGGDGADTYLIDNAGDVVSEAADEGIDLIQVTAAGTYTLGDNVENGTVTAANVAANLTGNALDNQLTGNAAANTLIGGAGNDTLDGGAGADKLSGGLGDDTYVVDVAGDVVTELANQGNDTVKTTLATYTLGASLENATYTGAANFSAIGNALDNIISAGKGNDSLQGGAGNDTFVSGTGKDTIDGGAGNDALEGLGNFGSYTITRPSATDTVLTDASGNILTVRNVERFVFADGELTLPEVQDNIASIGNDNLHGTAGNDTLNGLQGVDTLTGGDGADTYVIDNAGDVVIEAAGEGIDLIQVTAAGTYTLADNVENGTVTAANVAANLTGNALDNKLVGNAAANTLIGGAGSDKLDGGAGNDKLIGGTGNDVYYVGEAGDVVTELAGEGTDVVITTLATYTLGANVENLSSTGKATFTGVGNALNNFISASFGNGAKLDGGAGNDSLIGGAGNDSLLGGLGDDYLVGHSGKDTIDGGAGTDRTTLFVDFDQYTVTRPNATDTVLTDGQGNATLFRNVEVFLNYAGDEKTLEQMWENVASIGNDKLLGTAGADTLNGGLGVDTLSGGDGNDTYVIENANDVVIENANQGSDLVNLAFTAAGTYVLPSNVENATVTAASVAVHITGNDLDNLLTGNAAANTLIGGAGNDTLVGGAGSDTLNGGLGNDTYVVDAAGDKIIDGQFDDVDNVLTSLASYTLAADLNNLKYTGAAAFAGTGNAVANLVEGGAGNDVLKGLAGNDTLAGGAGSDTLTGGADADLFVLNSLVGGDTIADFVSGVDSISVTVAVGDNDGELERAELRAVPGGFATDAELVLFTQKMASASTANAAKVIGSAAGAYDVGDSALFVVSTATAATLYRFVSSGADAVVSAAELTQLAVLVGTPSVTLGDFGVAA